SLMSWPFPYTTLFRSSGRRHDGDAALGPDVDQVLQVAGLPDEAVAVVDRDHVQLAAADSLHQRVPSGAPAVSAPRGPRVVLVDVLVGDRRGGRQQAAAHLFLLVNVGGVAHHG